jgi:acetoacetyl-CoA reductase/3-oxoacyl-[acyl-carrier protein] reductase
MQNFLNEGETVCGTYQTTPPDENLKPHMKKEDVSNYKDVDTWIRGFKTPPEDITLLNCAGTNYNAFTHKADPETWARVINVNLIGTFNVIHALLPMMREQKFGRIINFSSVVGQMGVPGTSAYSASKTGMYGLTKSIAVENASKGITINNLRLGYFDIGMISDVPEKFQQAIKDKIPSGRFGDPRNIWNAIQFLRENDYVNGTNIDMSAAIV